MMELIEIKISGKDAATVKAWAKRIATVVDVDPCTMSGSDGKRHTVTLTERVEDYARRDKA